VSVFYKFISTRTTYATTIPLNTPLGELTRRVRSALAATSYPTLVGELREFPLPVAIPGFLLSDGSSQEKLSFPELAAYLGAAFDDPDNEANFLLPDYVGIDTPAPTYPPQVVDGATVSTGGDTSEPTQPGQTGGTVGGSPSSGGRPQNGEPDNDEL
jgi:hypothetical protein